MAKEWKHLLDFRCTGCANCCKEPIVLVTDQDVKRIMKHTGQTAEEIVDFYKPSEIEWGKREPGWIKLSSGRRIMGLRRKKIGCQYLGEDDLCTIYEHRPVTCRRYPFDIEFDEKGKIEFLSISDSVECLYELDGHNTTKELKALCTWEEKEEEPYYEKLKEWNRKRKRKGKKKFLTYIGF